jgi:HD-GYP domain-containing protein (c-di-GMP phosphodiesterase class II)
MAPVNGMSYQLLDSIGKRLFSTETSPGTVSPVKEIQDLSAEVINENSFQYTRLSHNGFLCGIPVKNEQKIQGMIVAWGPIPEKYPAPEPDRDKASAHAAIMEHFLGNLATLAETSLDTHRELEQMTRELEQNFEDLYLYGQISTQVNALKISSHMMTNLVKELLDNMRADAAFALLPNRQKYNADVIAPGFTKKFSSQKNIFENLIEHIPTTSPSLSENYFILNNSAENQTYQSFSQHPYRFLAVKVQHLDNFYGWLGLVSFNLEEIFRHGELKLLISLAEQLAMVIANTDLYKDLEQFVINMVKSLVFAIEAKDVYTRGHSERVSKYSMWIGERLGLEEKEYDKLKWSSILHDIGKIGIPESILNKPGRLTDDEFDIIKGHPKKGGEILLPVEQLSESIPGIIHHHERYDGNGYPAGLKGEEIPLTARIISVADTFDAISSSRAYRDAKSEEKAMSIIEEVAGTQLDAGLVAIFKEVHGQKNGQKDNR